jgi:hypothetical protein
MLKDGMYYEETDKKADQKTYKMITKLLHEYEGELHKEEIAFVGLGIQSDLFLTKGPPISSSSSS